MSTDQKTPTKTIALATTLKRKPPFETLDVGEAIDRAKALLRGRPPKADAQKWSDRLTRYEDWLELHHPRDDRSTLRALRHRLDDRVDRKSKTLA